MMKRIFYALSSLALLLGTTAAPAETLLGCLRSFYLQPSLAKDKDGNQDVILPAVRNGKPGFYFFSGDDSGKSPLFIKLNKKERDGGTFELSFEHPDSKRKIHIQGVGFNVEQPLLMQVIATDAKDSQRQLHADEIEVAQDAKAAEALDTMIARLAPAKAEFITKSSTGLALMSPNLIPNMPKIGMNDPKVKEIYEKEKRDGAPKIADAYIKAVPDMLKFNDEMLDSYQRHLERFCPKVGPQGTKAVTDTITALKASKETNVKLRLKLPDALTATLPEALKDAKDRTYSSADRLQLFIAGHIEARAEAVRREIAGQKDPLLVPHAPNGSGMPPDMIPLINDHD